jgi:hypothetical protein
MCRLAGVSRSTIQDAVMNNTGFMMFCVGQSQAISKGMAMDLAKNTRTVGETKFEGASWCPRRGAATTA